MAICSFCKKDVKAPCVVEGEKRQELVSCPTLFAQPIGPNGRPVLEREGCFVENDLIWGTAFVEIEPEEAVQFGLPMHAPGNA